MENSFDQDLIYAIFKMVWSKKTIEREKNEDGETSKAEERAGTSKKNRPTSANSNAVKLSCELLRLFVTEAVQRAATIAEAEGGNKIEATHLERILPQLLLDF
ncbi:protein MHF2 homolog [Cynara cardunculus var. scolymus]|uniref:CENP-S complex, centromere protein X n=1 Tax=Cynara cardunculus var. scolymus TaxID=59895 RepID=A0A103XXX1_CYNCS|nr:protein MHF2 homolog [Cynara cardunculus var. scolymus]XP_024977372.1 protein MHF2 homolog [Cynara cardunculus var. scolymus]KVH98973.1 CENP-S complex, centromere protein X [Cynara cardunculus var. scolymus]